MEAMLNEMRRQAARERANHATTRLGVISSYNSADHTVKVVLQPDGTETGWMPLGTLWSGNGWGMYCAPVGGEQVEVEFQEDGHEVPVCVARFYDDAHRPLNVPGGEFWLVHQSGAYLKLTNDGKVLMNAASEIDIGNAGSALMTLATSAIMAIFNEHTHPVSGDVTGAPTQQLMASDFTTVLRAN